MTQTTSAEAPQGNSQASFRAGHCAARGNAQGAAVFGHARFRRCGAGIPRHDRKREGDLAAGQGGLEPRALWLSFGRRSARHRGSEPVAAVAPQHASRPVRGGIRRLSGARARHRQHDADRGRHGRDRCRHADLDRGRPRRDGIVLPAPRQTPGRGRDLHPHPYRPLGRGARRARRRNAGERPGADH